MLPLSHTNHRALRVRQAAMIAFASMAAFCIPHKAFSGAIQNIDNNAISCIDDAECGGGTCVDGGCVGVPEMSTMLVPAFMGAAVVMTRRARRKAAMRVQAE